MTIEERLERLERENRRLKYLFIFPSLSGCSGFLHRCKNYEERKPYPR
jgi:hypothetical protein